MYIMFPIGWMYYFGVNLDNKFTVKDFWPTKAQLNSVPTEREEIAGEIERLKKKRLVLREQRRMEEQANGSGEGFGDGNGTSLDLMGENVARAVEREGKGWLSWSKSR